MLATTTLQEVRQSTINRFDWQHISKIMKGTNLEEKTTLKKILEKAGLTYALACIGASNASKSDIRKFARDCALDVSHEWGDMPDVVRQYLETGDDSKKDAAYSLAKDASFCEPTWGSSWGKGAIKRKAAEAACMAAAPIDDDFAALSVLHITSFRVEKEKLIERQTARFIEMFCTNTE